MAEYDVTEREGVSEDFPVYRATKVEMGNLVSLNATGYAIESTDAANTVCVGVAEKTVDNSSGSDGDLRVPVRKLRIFRLKNSTGNPVTTALSGTLCFVEDSATVCANAGSTNKNIVGVVGGNVTADYAEVYIGGRTQYAEASLVDFSIGQDLTVTRDATVGRNLGITAGNITNTLGNLVLTAGNATLTKGNLVLTEGALTMTKGSATLTAGDLTLTKGGLTLTEGAALLTKGNLTVTDGDIIVTKGMVTVGLTADDGFILPYAAADGGAGAVPTKASLAAAFGAVAVGRNGWAGAFANTNGVGSKFLVSIQAGEWYAVALTVGA